MKKIFKKFMESHNAWERWKSNTGEVETFLMRCERHIDYIELAFNWSDSAEGESYCYWDNLDDLWRARVEAHILWEKLGDTPIDEMENIEEPFQNFPVGANRLAIWLWFEETYNLSVVKDLMFTDY